MNFLMMTAGLLLFVNCGRQNEQKRQGENSSQDKNLHSSRFSCQYYLANDEKNLIKQGRQRWSEGESPGSILNHVRHCLGSQLKIKGGL